MKILGWYSLIMMTLSIIITIAKDGESTTKYTGKYKLMTLILNLPILYFMYQSLIKIL